MTTELIVPLDLAPAPYILANSGFLATLAQVEEQVSTLNIHDAESDQLAATLLVRLTTAGVQLEKTRKELTAPFRAAADKIMEVSRGPAGRIEAAKVALKKQQSTYNEDQRRKAAEAERVRQAEIRRLDDLRKAEIAAEMKKIKEAEDAAKAALAAVAPADLGMCLDDDEPVAPPPKTEVQRALETLQHAPVVVAPKPVGVTMRVTLVPTITDVMALPEPFVERVPKMAAIKAVYTVGWTEGKAIPECPGVKFTVNREPVSSGRARF